jgi:hypothetical protein
LFRTDAEQVILFVSLELQLTGAAVLIKCTLFNLRKRLTLCFLFIFSLSPHSLGTTQTPCIRASAPDPILVSCKYFASGVLAASNGLPVHPDEGMSFSLPCSCRRRRILPKK